jgi:hypothetical protein
VSAIVTSALATAAAPVITIAAAATHLSGRAADDTETNTNTDTDTDADTVVIVVVIFIAIVVAIVVVVVIVIDVVFKRRTGTNSVAMRAETTIYALLARGASKL